MSVYVYAGVLNYETVSHFEHIWYLVRKYYEICIKQVRGYVGLSDAD